MKKTRHSHQPSMSPLLGVVAGFALGAIATYFLGRGITRQRIAEPASDAVLAERVRMRLGDWVSHPEAIDVSVEHGIVRLSGRVLAQELDGLLTRLTDMPGVYKVRNALSSLANPVAFDQVREPDRETSLLS